MSEGNVVLVAIPINAVVADFLQLADDSAVAILPHALRLAAELRLAELLDDGPRTVKELAIAANCDSDALYRLIRALTSAGFFRRCGKDCYELAELGRRLLPDSADSIYSTAVNPVSQRVWLSAVRTMRTGEPVFGAGRPGHGAAADPRRSDFFRFMETDDRANQDFLYRMRERAARLYPELVSAVDWRRSRVLLDIGGGRGHVLDRVLRAVPHLHGVLFDRPATIDLVAQRGEAEAGDGLSARRTLRAGDFFNEIPDGADTHLMCSVLHDWEDDKAATILANSRRSLRPAGRLLIVEMVVPEEDDWHPSKWSDLGMLVLTGGRERTTDEFARLLGSAGYVLRSVRAVPRSHFQVLTASPQVLNE